mmetsp:Transcript_82885/g.239797  ORF Transcript_82885/g.239797 Transcript_82885/m.239797 type:complete len:451 (-) Transcript_82885:35-1387(-)
MSKPFDYSKWDKIELSDDEEDVHPNIDRESWFRMKHRSRVEREEHEEKDKQRIMEEMAKAEQRMKMLERDLKKIQKHKEDDSDDDDDDLDDAEAIRIELEDLKTKNRERQAKLDEYEKNKKWNVDNMFEVKEERTLINANAGKSNYTPTGFAQSTVTGEEVKKQFASKKEEDNDGDKEPAKTEKPKEAAPAPAAAPKAEPKPAAAAPQPAKKPAGPSPPKSKASPPSPTEVDSDPNFVYSYHEFTDKYADLVEQFMTLKSFDESKEFLLKHGDILLQEHACNYLLLASLEDEMNGYREKMTQTAKQSQIVTNIAELAKSWNTHPGNCIMPFFQRLNQREFLEGFLAGLETFKQKIISRAVTKKIEMDRAREKEHAVEKEGVDISQLPKEERLGPGGLDPLEVIETLPVSMQEAFESRDVDKLKEALLKMDQKDAEYHMKRCVDSGLWQAG